MQRTLGCWEHILRIIASTTLDPTMMLTYVRSPRSNQRGEYRAACGTSTDPTMCGALEDASIENMISVCTPDYFCEPRRK